MLDQRAGGDQWHLVAAVPLSPADGAYVLIGEDAKPFFEAVTQRLAQRHVYNHTLWAYGIKHNVVAAARERPPSLSLRVRPREFTSPRK